MREGVKIWNRGHIVIWTVRVCVCLFGCRTHTRRAGTSISYKEESEDEKTDSDEITEVNWDESVQNAASGETDTADTIEKVLAQRRGKKGGKFPMCSIAGRSGCNSYISAQP